MRTAPEPRPSADRMRGEDRQRAAPPRDELGQSGPLVGKAEPAAAPTAAGS
jgi:hypothetical protein